MSDIAKELFNSIITNNATPEAFNNAVASKMDQALEIRKANLSSEIYNNNESPEKEVVEESADLKEANNSDLNKVMKAASQMGKVKGNNTVDCGGTKITFSIEKGKIKMDGGKSLGVEYFDNAQEAITALSVGIED